MKKVVRLTERDLTKIVKRVIKEGAMEAVTPEEFIKGNPNAKGTFQVYNGVLTLTLSDNRYVFELSCIK